MDGVACELFYVGGEASPNRGYYLCVRAGSMRRWSSTRALGGAGCGMGTVFGCTFHGRECAGCRSRLAAVACRRRGHPIGAASPWNVTHVCRIYVALVKPGVSRGCAFADVATPHQLSNNQKCLALGRFSHIYSRFAARWVPWTPTSATSLPHATNTVCACAQRSNRAERPGASFRPRPALQAARSRPSS